jgi:hypothetical protein
MLAYKAAGIAKLDRKLIERRWGPATTEDRHDFAAALETVRAHVRDAA